MGNKTPNKHELMTSVENINFDELCADMSHKNNRKEAITEIIRQLLAFLVSPARRSVLQRAVCHLATRIDNNSLFFFARIHRQKLAFILRSDCANWNEILHLKKVGLPSRNIVLKFILTPRCAVCCFQNKNSYILLHFRFECCTWQPLAGNRNLLTKRRFKWTVIVRREELG